MMVRKEEAIESCVETFGTALAKLFLQLNLTQRPNHQLYHIRRDAYVYALPSVNFHILGVGILTHE